MKRLAVIVSLVFLVASGCATDDRPFDPAGTSLGTTVNPDHPSFRIAVLAPSQGGEVVLDGIDLAFDGARGEVSFRASLVNSTDRPLFTPLELVITDLRPDGIVVANADRRTDDGAPLFDFSEEAGEDGALAPGEASRRVRMVFTNPERAAFILGAALHTGIGPAYGAVGGVVFLDQKPNGKRDRGEPGIPGIPVVLQNGADVLAETRTSSEGRYVFLNLLPGLYGVRQDGSDLDTVTPNPLYVALVPAQGGQAVSFLTADFACFRRRDPGEEPAPVFGPLRVLASGETITGHFPLNHLPRMPLLLLVEVVGAEHRPLTEAEVMVNGQRVLTTADFPLGTRLVRREMLPDLLRVGENTVEVRARRDGESEENEVAFLVVTVIGQ
jgi:hypothetical protein